MRGRFDSPPRGILDETHLRFFTKKSATELCENAGLELLRTTQNPMLVRAAKDWIAKLYLSEDTGDRLLLVQRCPGDQASVCLSALGTCGREQVGRLQQVALTLSVVAQQQRQSLGKR